MSECKTLEFCVHPLWTHKSELCLFGCDQYWLSFALDFGFNPIQIVGLENFSNFVKKVLARICQSFANKTIGLRQNTTRLAAGLLQDETSSYQSFRFFLFCSLLRSSVRLPLFLLRAKVDEVREGIDTDRIGCGFVRFRLKRRHLSEHDGNPATKEKEGGNLHNINGF